MLFIKTLSLEKYWYNRGREHVTWIFHFFESNFEKKIMTMINCFVEWLTDKKALSLIASQNHCLILTYQLHNSNAPKQDFNLCRIRLKLCQKRKLCNSDKLLHHNVTKHYGLKLSSYGTLFFIKSPDFLIFAMS